jgi:hypothetical protein
VPVVEGGVPGGQATGQAVRADLFVRVFAGQQAEQVVAGVGHRRHAHLEAEHRLPGLDHAREEWQPGQEQQRHQPRLDRQERDDDPADRGQGADGADQAVDELQRPVRVRRHPLQPVVERRGLVRRQLDLRGHGHVEPELGQTLGEELAGRVRVRALRHQQQLHRRRVHPRRPAHTHPPCRIRSGRHTIRSSGYHSKRSTADDPRPSRRRESVVR